MQGKIVVITGGNAGIGFETAKELARQGANVFIVCRNENKGLKALEEIKRETDNLNVQMKLCDMGSQKQIRGLGESLRNGLTHIDVLINNAGAYFSEYKETEDGIERQFAINHLGYFLFTSELMPLLLKSESARIVNTSSNGHFRGKMHWNDLNLKKNYHGWKAYCQSKLCNVLFTKELARQLNGKPVTVNALHPGVVKTDIGSKAASNPLHRLVWWFSTTFFGLSTWQGAQTTLYAATSDEMEGVSGEYLAKSKVGKSSDASHSLDDAKRLWDISLEMCNINDYFNPQ